MIVEGDEEESTDREPPAANPACGNAPGGVVEVVEVGSDTSDHPPLTESGPSDASAQPRARAPVGSRASSADDPAPPAQSAGAVSDGRPPPPPSSTDEEGSPAVRERVRQLEERLAARRQRFAERFPRSPSSTLPELVPPPQAPQRGATP